ncbi:MAG: hypothetical protein KAS82_02525 [Bacteroidales bacterium]|nr:hypothetical protein [Bacteroidales bacterium]
MKKHRSSTFKKTIPLTLLLIIVVSPLLLAQEADHVYLKSGSVIRGKIIEIEPVDHVKIEDMCGNIWFYKITDVEKITSEPFESGIRRDQEPIGFEAGFVNMTSIGFLAGSSHNSQVAPFSLLMVNGYRTSHGLFAGIGTGIEFFSTNYLPLFLDLRGDLLEGDVVPYVMAKGGYGLPLSSDRSDYDISYEYSGGLLFGAGVGLKIRTRNHFAWDIELLYRYQETSYREIHDWNNQEYEYTDIFNRIEIRLGFYID